METKTRPIVEGASSDKRKTSFEASTETEPNNAKRKRLTMAELDALERYGKNPAGCRRSSRQLNRISTSRMRRLNDIFWNGDAHYRNEKQSDSSDNDSDNTDDGSDEESDTKKSKKRTNNGVLNLGKRHLWKKIHDSPHIYVMDNFLNESEIRYCQSKINKTRFLKSVVDKFDVAKSESEEVGGSNAGRAVVEEDQRTSTFCTFAKMEHAKVASMEQRVAELLGFTIEQLEPLQLVRYEAGQFFGVHHDLGVLYEDGSVELPPKVASAPPRRLVTVFCYLNNVGRGGCTYFPMLNLRVQPKRGRAVLFCNIDKHGMPDPRTIHAGEPVLAIPPMAPLQTTNAPPGASEDNKNGKKSNIGHDDWSSALLNPNIKYGINIWACES